MKKELEEIRAELNILSRTESILTSRAGDIDDFLKQLEKQKGISGYTNINKRAEDIAMQKKNLDQAKDKNLEELTKLVEDIENQLKDKKAKLAPQIKQLRAYRQKYQELEQTYNEKKKAYDNTVMNLETEKHKLVSDIEKSWNDYKQEETKYHYMNIQTKIYEVL